MADRIVAVGVTAQTAAYVAGMNKASAAAAKTAGATERIGSSVDKTAAKMNTFRNIALYAFGYGMAAGAVKALKSVVSGMMDFEDAMANLGSASMATEADLESMRQAALKAGQDTVFTATEAANAMTELSKAGVSTSDILGGALAGALDLAAAGQVDVAFAAETAATAMVQFNLSGSQMSHVADLLAAGAGKAQGGVEDLALALRQGGQVASMVGWSFEDTTTALTAFAAAGLLGSDAGTSLKTMLLRLARPSNQAAEVMDRYGLSVYDASGNMVGASELAGRLTTAFANLEPEARNAAMGIIFGTDAVRAANVLYSEGQVGIARWGTAVNDAGYAAEVAARKNDTLRGDLNKLAGTFDAIINGSGGGFVDLLRSIAQAADDALKDTQGTIDDINALIDDTLGKWHYKDDPLLSPEADGDFLGQMVDDFAGQLSEMFNGLLLLPQKLNQELYPSLYEGERAMDAWGARLTAAADAHDRMAAAAGNTADSVGGVGAASLDAAGDIEAVEEAAAEAREEIERMADAIEGLGSDTLNLRDAQRQAQQAIDDARKSVKENGATLDINTQKGRNNAAALDELAASFKKQAAATVLQTGSQKKANAVIEDGREAFIRAADAMNIGAGKAEKLANRLGLVPRDVETTVTQPGMDTAMSKASTYAEQLRGLDRTVRTTIEQHFKVTGERVAGVTGSGGRTFADGGWASAPRMASAGWVSGPGGPRSDMIRAWLSNGEFVVNARAASDYGPLLEAINKGMHPMPAGGDTIYVQSTTESVARDIEARQRVRALARRVA